MTDRRDGAQTPEERPPNRFAAELQEVHDLIARSSDAINHQDWALLEAMMTDDVVWERTPPNPWMLEGRTAVHRFLEGNSAKIDILYYIVAASAIDFADKNHAAARSTMSELIRVREKRSTIHVVGTYTDDFVKIEGRWLFARRAITPRFEHQLKGKWSDGSS